MALFALCAAAAVLSVGPAQAQSVVLEARGPSAALFPKGKVLSPNAHVDLKLGDVLRVIDAAGVHTLTGPGGATPAVHDSRLSDIFRREKVRVSQLAVARGVPADPRPKSVANLWQVDVSSNTAVTACVAPEIRPSLWRWTADQTQDVEITEKGGRAQKHLTWQAGSQSLDWPEDLPTGPENQYIVRLDDNPPVVLIWRTVQAPSADMAAFAQDLLDKGCVDQFHALEMASGANAGA
jgi:hypothetical protein